MIRIEKHAQEAFWLQRRIDFIEKMNDVLEEDGTLDDAELISSQYKKVENPEDVIKRLKEIYGRDLK